MHALDPAQLDVAGRGRAAPGAARASERCATGDTTRSGMPLQRTEEYRSARETFMGSRPWLVHQFKTSPRSKPVCTRHWPR
jgi:hypothetical protein